PARACTMLIGVTAGSVSDAVQSRSAPSAGDFVRGPRRDAQVKRRAGELHALDELGARRDDPDIAAEALRRAPRDRQADADAAVLAGHGAVDLEERLEDPVRSL